MDARENMFLYLLFKKVNVFKCINLTSLSRHFSVHHLLILSFKHNICLAAVVIGLSHHCNDTQNTKLQDMVHFSSSEDKQKVKVIEPMRQAAQEACLLYFLLLC